MIPGIQIDARAALYVFIGFLLGYGAYSFQRWLEATKKWRG